MKQHVGAKFLKKISMHYLSYINNLRVFFSFIVGISSFNIMDKIAPNFNLLSVY